MKIKLYFALIAATLLFNACDDFLDRKPLDETADENYWTNEQNVRTFAWGFYTSYFTGYGSNYAWGNYFTGESLNDDFAAANPSQFVKNVPDVAGGWSFTMVRKANLFIDRVAKVPMGDDAIKHWTGVARFFRGLEYAGLVNRFGDVPWYGKVLNEKDTKELYKPRDPRTTVMDSVLKDFKYAAANVRASDGDAGLTVNKYVVLAYMSRVFLFEGTYLKYHEELNLPNQAEKAIEYLKAAKWAAGEVIKSGKYAVSNDYRGLFSSLDLKGNTEMILYRSYATGFLTHCLLSYVNKESQTGASKSAVDAYLCTNGLPISSSNPLYKGDRSISDVMANRDPRMGATINSQLKLNGLVSNYSSSGYSCVKFLNESVKDLPEGSSANNTTDAPVIRYGEVLVNYAEACVELGGAELAQNDLDISVNMLRKRNVQGFSKVSPLEVVGGLPAVNGVVYDDPNRDKTVSSMIWEVRRERRVELIFEGFRFDDLRRWKKLFYTNTTNTDVNRGAWIKLSDWKGINGVVVDGGTEGYITPATSILSHRVFDEAKDNRVYLFPLPLNQITLYKEQNVILSQNPGW